MAGRPGVAAQFRLHRWRYCGVDSSIPPARAVSVRLVAMGGSHPPTITKGQAWWQDWVGYSSRRRASPRLTRARGLFVFRWIGWRFSGVDHRPPRVLRGLEAELEVSCW